MLNRKSATSVVSVFFVQTVLFIDAVFVSSAPTVRARFG